jgi:hypothetical protein
MATIALEGGVAQPMRAHPPGLWTLAATELWDRASFYGMQALIILYMTQYLLLPGHAEQVIGLGALNSAIASLRGPLSVEGQATQIFALYVTLLGFLPLVGGWLGDRFVSRRAGVIAGASLMTLGHLALGFTSTFLIGLVLVLAGAGLLRGNVTPQIRALRRRRPAHRRGIPDFLPDRIGGRVHLTADHRHRERPLWLPPCLRHRGRRNARRTDLVRGSNEDVAARSATCRSRPGARRAIGRGEAKRHPDGSISRRPALLLDGAGANLEHLQHLGE